MKRSARMFLGAVTLILISAGGCVTRKPEEPVRPLTDAERARYMKSAKPPEAFGLNVARSESGPVFSGAQRVYQGQLGIIPFISGGKSPAPVVEITVVAKDSIQALVDTTARDNWCTLPTTEHLNGVPLGPRGFGRYADHILGDVSGILFLAPRIKMDKVEIGNSLFYARDAFGPLGPLDRFIEDAKPEAVLGLSALRSFALVQFDFPNHQLILAADKSPEPDPDRLLATVPLVEVDGALACDAILNDRSGRFLLDVAGNFEIAMRNPPAAKMRQLSIGDLVVRQVGVQSSDDLGVGLQDYPRIGRRILERFVVTIDFRGRQIHFERPASR